MMFLSLGIGAAVAIALIVVVSILTGGGPAARAKNALVGTRIHHLSMAGLSGGTVKSPWTDGHPAVLIFFASWCGPCQREMPGVATYLRAHGSGSVVVVGVDALDARGPAEHFVARDRVTFPVVFDPNGAVTAGVFNFQTLPETVFLNARGVVTDVYFGAIPKDALVAGIKKLA